MSFIEGELICRRLTDCTTGAQLSLILCTYNSRFTEVEFTGLHNIHEYHTCMHVYHTQPHTHTHTHTSSHHPRMSYQTHSHAHLYTHLMHTHDILVGVNLKPAGAPQCHLHGGGVPETQTHAASGVCRAWLPQLSPSLQQRHHDSQTQDCHPGVCVCVCV